MEAQEASPRKLTLNKVDFSRLKLQAATGLCPLRGMRVTNYADIAVRGSVENVQQLVQSAFVANQFSVSWASAVKGKAEKGSKGLNLALGALAQYYGIDFEIYPGQGTAVLRLYQANTGWAGGMIGAHRVKKQFEELHNLLVTWFQQQGVLAGTVKAKV